MHKSPYPALILTFLIYVVNVWTVLANLVKVIACRKLAFGKHESTAEDIQRATGDNA